MMISEIVVCYVKKNTCTFMTLIPNSQFVSSQTQPGLGMTPKTQKNIAIIFRYPNQKSRRKCTPYSQSPK